VKNTYLSTYLYYIKASNGPDLWPENGFPPVHPSAIRRAPGRPKKARKKANYEPQDRYKLPRQKLSVVCKFVEKLDTTNELVKVKQGLTGRFLKVKTR